MLTSRDPEPPARWRLHEPHGIAWEPQSQPSLPHEDHIELTGSRVSLILRYRLDPHAWGERKLLLRRQVIWPNLRGHPTDLRGYLQRTYEREIEPRIERDGRPVELGAPLRVIIDGTIRFEQRLGDDLVLVRELYPSPDEPVVHESWTIQNSGPAAVTLGIIGRSRRDTDAGMYGRYVIEASCDAPPQLHVPAGGSAAFAISIRAALASASTMTLDWQQDRAARQRIVDAAFEPLVLETPDPVLNRAFELAKLRASECLIHTPAGLVHSPTGGSFYGGVWANDQVEYSGPFFPWLGDARANEAALTAYRMFAAEMTDDFRPIPSSFEVECSFVMRSIGDRGDAAMYAYGASLYALLRGDAQVARELWPAIQWSLEYCRRKMTRHGVIASDTDELERRFPAGDANLSTSSLAYAGLLHAADLGESIGADDSVVDEYRRRAAALRDAIEQHFGAHIEGFATYRYYEDNTVLRSWICLPLCFGILGRAEGTLAALFSPRLWTKDGLATQAGDVTFWDRSTLYALRGVFRAGAADVGLDYLARYTRRRLLGDHVPYPVEAWPEGGQAHLSAESALYCRIFVEGMLGIVPRGLGSFDLTPRLPSAWDRMALRRARAFGTEFDIEVRRAGPQRLAAAVTVAGRRLDLGEHPAGHTWSVRLPVVCS